MTAVCSRRQQVIKYVFCYIRRAPTLLEQFDIEERDMKKVRNANYRASFKYIIIKRESVMQCIVKGIFYILQELVIVIIDKMNYQSLFKSIKNCKKILHSGKGGGCFTHTLTRVIFHISVNLTHGQQNPKSKQTKIKPSRNHLRQSALK